MNGDLFLENEDFSLLVAIDSSETLYQFKLKSLDDSYLQAGALLKNRSLNQKAHEIFAFSASDLDGEKITLPLERLLFALKILIKRFQGSDIYKEETAKSDLANLICRCSFLDKKDIEESFVSAKGDFKKGILSNQATLICSACLKDVKNIYDQMSFAELEKRREQIKMEVQEALDEFSMFCPAEFEGVSFKVTSVKDDFIKIKVLNKKEGLTRPNIKKTLENYLPAKATQDLEISVFF